MALTKIYENVFDQERKLVSITSDVDIVHAEGTTPAGEEIPAPTTETITGSKKLLVPEGGGIPGQVVMVDPENSDLRVVISLGEKQTDPYQRVTKHPAWEQLETDGEIVEGFADPLPALPSIAVLSQTLEQVAEQWQGDLQAAGFDSGDGYIWAIEDEKVKRAAQGDWMRDESMLSIRDMKKRIDAGTLDLSDSNLDVMMIPMNASPFTMNGNQRIQLYDPMFAYIKLLVEVGMGGRGASRQYKAEYDAGVKTYDEASAAINYVLSQYSKTDGVYDQTPSQIKAALGL